MRPTEPISWATNGYKSLSSTHLREPDATTTVCGVRIPADAAAVHKFGVVTCSKCLARSRA